MQILDEFISKSINDGIISEKREIKSKPDEPKEKEIIKSNAKSLLLGVGYDGDKGLAYAKLYDVKSDKIVLWFDDTGHKPYCISDQPIETLKENKDLVNKKIKFRGISCIPA